MFVIRHIYVVFSGLNIFCSFWLKICLRVVYDNCFSIVITQMCDIGEPFVSITATETITPQGNRANNFSLGIIDWNITRAQF